MKVTIKFFKGPQPEEVTFTDVESITTHPALGYLVLVIHYQELGSACKYATPLYLVADIAIERG